MVENVFFAQPPAGIQPNYPRPFLDGGGKAPPKRQTRATTAGAGTTGRMAPKGNRAVQANNPFRAPPIHMREEGGDVLAIWLVESAVNLALWVPETGASWLKASLEDRLDSQWKKDLDRLEAMKKAAAKARPEGAAPGAAPLALPAPVKTAYDAMLPYVKENGPPRLTHRGLPRLTHQAAWTAAGALPNPVARNQAQRAVALMTEAKAWVIGQRLDRVGKAEGALSADMAAHRRAVAAAEQAIEKALTREGRFAEPAKAAKEILKAAYRNGPDETLKALRGHPEQFGKLKRRPWTSGLTALTGPRAGRRLGLDAALDAATTANRAGAATEIRLNGLRAEASGLAARAAQLPKLLPPPPLEATATRTAAPERPRLSGPPTPSAQPAQPDTSAQKDRPAPRPAARQAQLLAMKITRGR